MRILVFGVIQGLLVGSVGGWALGLYLWQESSTQLAALKPPPPQCPSCPSAPCIPSPEPPSDSSSQTCAPYPFEHQCVALSSETFMKKATNVDQYFNKRVHFVYEVLTEQQCNFVVRHSSAEQAAPGAVLSFPKEGSWVWLYKRIHEVILQENEELWQFRLPQNYTSALVEDLLLVKYTNETEFRHEVNWAPDVGTVGPTGKRILTALLHLNFGYEGGHFSAQVQTKPYDIQTSPRILWMMNAFLPRRKTRVITGTQYVLFYRIKRY